MNLVYYLLSSSTFRSDTIHHKLASPDQGWFHRRCETSIQPDQSLKSPHQNLATFVGNCISSRYENQINPHQKEAEQREKKHPEIVSPDGLIDDISNHRKSTQLDRNLSRKSIGKIYILNSLQEIILNRPKQHYLYLYFLPPQHYSNIYLLERRKEEANEVTLKIIS